MSRTLTPAVAQHAAGGAELTGVLTQLLRRYAAEVPAGELNDVDRAVARALDQIPGARRIAGRMVRRVLERSSTDGGLALDHAIGLDEVQAAFEQFPSEQEAVGTRGEQPSVDTRSTYRYELQFSHLICKDETDPEFWGSDEIYLVFAWITEAEAKQGSPAHVVRTPVYEDIDDGDRRPRSGSQNLRVFGPQNMGDGVAVTATCMEQDDSELAAVLLKISVAMTSAAAAAALLGPIAAKVVAIAAAVTAFIANALQDDQIGATVPLAFTQATADALTATTSSVMLPFLEHRQSDGHYRSFLQLRRV